MVRGKIYVTRLFGGEVVYLQLDNQLAYREWGGCWSAI